MGSWVMYYNKDLVDKYIPGALDDGIVTYEEINQAGEKAKADGVYSFGYTWGCRIIQSISANGRSSSESR